MICLPSSYPSICDKSKNKYNDKYETKVKDYWLLFFLSWQRQRQRQRLNKNYLPLFFLSWIALLVAPIRALQGLPHPAHTHKSRHKVKLLIHRPSITSHHLVTRRWLFKHTKTTLAIPKNPFTNIFLPFLFLLTSSPLPTKYFPSPIICFLFLLLYSSPSQTNKSTEQNRGSTLGPVLAIWTFFDRIMNFQDYSHIFLYFDGFIITNHCPECIDIFHLS